MTNATQQRNFDPPPNHLAVQPFSLRKMSCNGCRVLRKGCSDNCILRQCLQWIETPQSQANATVFVAKFFGRAGLMTFIQGVHETERPALFKSLLYEACGRTINPVHGAVGLLWTGKWQICQAAVQKVLQEGSLERTSTPPNCPSIDGNKPIVPTFPSMDTNAVAAPISRSVDAVESRAPDGNSSQEKFDIHRRTGIPDFSVVDNQGACKRSTDDNVSKIYEAGKSVTTENRRVRQRTEDGNNIAVTDVAGNNDAIDNVGRVINDSNLVGGHIDVAEVTSTAGSERQQNIDGNLGGDVKLGLSLNCRSKSSNLKQPRASSSSNNSVISEGSVNRQFRGPFPQSPQKLLDLL
ncbi:hypothetical protein SUGI_0231830 [Cryptomeria japonica]|nr:hypothetical protein SUGI_0231830 [Cryptomeria japonica]